MENRLIPMTLLANGKPTLRIYIVWRALPGDGLKPPISWQAGEVADRQARLLRQQLDPAYRRHAEFIHVTEG